MSATAVTRHPTEVTKELARRLARRAGATYEALDDARRAMFDELADEVVDYVGEDDFHYGCVPEEVLDDRVDDGTELGYQVGVELGLEQAKRRMIAGIDRLVEADVVKLGPASEIRTRIERMGVDWSDGDLALVAPQIRDAKERLPKSEESSG